MPNPENLIGKGFDSRPENINKNGRPRKSFATINAKLKKQGVEPLTKKQLLDFYELVFNATEKELVALRNDEETPFVMKMIIQELGSAATRSKALQDYRNYMFAEVDTGPEIRIIGYGETKQIESK
jgi:hypothetical protein